VPDLGALLPEDVLRQALGDRGLPASRVLVQMASPQSPKWAAHIAELLMRLPEDERPDGLIIFDDNLMTPACEGIIRAGVTPPEIVSHCNYPTTLLPPLPVSLLGFDITFLLRQCLTMLENARAGQTLPTLSHLSPRLPGETTSLAAHWTVERPSA
jgi:DNA-binding LacI/PurR family transcriptional regulator